MKRGVKVPRFVQLLDDRKKLAEWLDGATLGARLGLLRHLVGELDDADTDFASAAKLDADELQSWLGANLLNEMLLRHRRVDFREHWAMVAYLSELGFEIAHLRTGEGDFNTRRVSVERKEDDLLPSLFDGRRLRQLSAMREEAEFSYLIVTKSYEGVKQDVAERGVSERVLTGFIASLCVVGYPPLFIPDRYDAAQIVHRIVSMVEDDAPRLFVPRPASPRPIEYRNAIIESLPKVGAKTRRRITSLFPTIAALSSASIEELMEVEGVGRVTAERIVEILRGEG